MRLSFCPTATVKKILFVGAILATGLGIAIPVSSDATGRPLDTLDVAYGLCYPRDRQLQNTGLAPAPVYTVYCRPDTWAAGAPQVDVLSADFPDGADYWMAPADTETYSYIEKTLLAGRAVLAYDPAANEGETADDAYILHQLVRWMAEAGFTSITSVGDYYGSEVALYEAMAYRDVDKLVLAGFFDDQDTSQLTVPFMKTPAAPAQSFASIDAWIQATAP